MKARVKTFAAPNSIIFIADPSAPYDVPANTGSALVTATPTCVGIGTLAEMDGETKVSLGEELAPSGELIFDGEIATPGLQIAVIDSGANTQLSMAVQNSVTHVRIWANDPSEPDIICIEAR